jgi:hypothetical protein
MNFERIRKCTFWRTGTMLAAALFATALAIAEPHDRSGFVLTSTNNASSNLVVIFKLDTSGTPSLSLVNSLATGGKGGITPTLAFSSSTTISAPSQTSAPTLSAN